MKRIALIKDKKVHNVITAEPGYKPPKGFTAVEAETADIGDVYDGKTFTAADFKLSKANLIHEAKLRFDSAINLGISFDLAEPGEAQQIVRIPADIASRAEIMALAFVAEIESQDLSSVTRDCVLRLTSKHILGIREQVMRHVMEKHALLADLIQAIEEERVTNSGEIDAL